MLTMPWYAVPPASATESSRAAPAAAAAGPTPTAATSSRGSPLRTASASASTAVAKRILTISAPVGPAVGGLSPTRLAGITLGPGPILPGVQRTGLVEVKGAV